MESMVHSALADSELGGADQEVRYIHLKEITVEFIGRRHGLTSTLELVFKDEAGVEYKSNKFKEDYFQVIDWSLDIYVRTHTCATMTIQQVRVGVPSKISLAQIEIQFKPNEFGDYNSVEIEDRSDWWHCVTVTCNCGRSKSLADVNRFFGSQVTHGHLTPEPPDGSTSKRGYNIKYPAIHRLNNDILLGIFDCYRLDDDNGWNNRLGWRKLLHVCQRWRHLIYECTFHLGMHIKCTNGTPKVDMLDHLPPLPLLIDYETRYGVAVWPVLTEQDELGIYHALRLHDRVYHIHLNLPPSTFHKVFVLLAEQFPILEHLSLTSSATSKNGLPLTFPKAFLAPNLRHLALPGISPPRRLQLLTSAVFLVTLHIGNIQTSSYFHPRLLVARLQSLPRLEELHIGFAVPIPRPSTERELLGEQRTPVTLPSLKTLWFKGVGAYLESLVAQIRAPRLEGLDITLLNQIAFALPHLSNLIDITEAFKPPSATVGFYDNAVYLTMANGPTQSNWRPVLLRVMCNQLDWQIDCAAQICHALIPALSSIEELTLSRYEEIATELRNGAIDSATWNDLLRMFIGVKKLYIYSLLLEELSRALQVEEVGSDPGFLPHLGSILASDNLFTSFIDTRQVVGRPVQFVLR